MERIRGFLDAGRAHQIVTVNLDFLNIAERDPHFRDTINRADLAVADGMPLVWASRLTDSPLPQRIAGVDLVDACCEIAAERGAGVFLLGAGPGVAEIAAQRLKDLYPGLLIAGTYSPPFGELLTPGQRADGGDDPHGAPGVPLRRLRGPPPGPCGSGPTWSSWACRSRMGVGCVLDLLAGNVNRAPLWMQRSGLEWVFRLSQEPRPPLAALPRERHPHPGAPGAAGSVREPARRCCLRRPGRDQSEILRWEPKTASAGAPPIAPARPSSCWSPACGGSP